MQTTDLTTVVKKWNATNFRTRDALAAEHVMGWKWMRWHEKWVIDEGRPRRSLADPNEHRLEPPDYVEWDPNDPDTKNYWAAYHGPEFTSHPLGDYELLCRVRETWPDCTAFCHNLDAIWSRRRAGLYRGFSMAKELHYYYLAGDYAHAALIVLEEIKTELCT